MAIKIGKEKDRSYKWENQEKDKQSFFFKAL